MDNKFAIQVIKTGKWLNLDFHDGSNLTYIDKFTHAYHFNSIQEATLFTYRHKLNIKDCQLFKLQIFVQPIKW